MGYRECECPLGTESSRDAMLIPPSLEILGKGYTWDELIYSYCASVLQALYSSTPFRAFVESYPDVIEPQIPLGLPPGSYVPPSPAAWANGAASGPSSPIAVKSNPFDSPSVPSGGTPMSPGKETKEKRSWTGLGRRPTTGASAAPNLATLTQGHAAAAPEPAAPPPRVEIPHYMPNPDLPPPTVFSTIQTLFHHMSSSAPHGAPPPKTPGATTPGNQLNTSNGASLPSSTLTTSSSIPTSAPQYHPVTGLPIGPPLLASLPPPSAPRGGGPNGAGALGRGVVRPEDLLRTVKRENEMFRGMSQQDAHEFLGWLLNRIAEDVEALDRELKAKGQSVPQHKGNGKTWVQNLFEGVLTNETRCLSCETVSSCTGGIRILLI
jgi:ubiquitin carboxyl-terminal hydrolase 9/13